MKNVLGNSVTVTLFGESHGAEIGAVIDGIAPGIEVDLDFMRKQLNLRKPHGKISTQRVETDEPHIVSGRQELRFAFCLKITIRRAKIIQRQKI